MTSSAESTSTGRIWFLVSLGVILSTPWCTLKRTGDIGAAIAREKQIKKWNRAWKLSLIEKTNPGWRDLYNDIT
jgi:hypothetical protein